MIVRFPSDWERPEFGAPKDTPEEARDARLMGWNLRCNSCGKYGAQWVPKMRPGWGDLALCHPEAKHLAAMQARHRWELAAHTTVNFEQPPARDIPRTMRRSGPPRRRPKASEAPHA